MEPVTTYAIFCHGKYFSGTRGYGRGFGWSEGFDGAKLYVVEKAMKRDLNAIARSLLGGPYPEVHEFQTALVRKIDHTEEFKKNRERAEKAEATRQRNANKYRAKEVEDRVKHLRAELEAEERNLAGYRG